VHPVHPLDEGDAHRLHCGPQVLEDVNRPERTQNAFRLKVARAEIFRV
jgi:hypothetical protein